MPTSHPSEKVFVIIYTLFSGEIVRRVKNRSILDLFKLLPLFCNNKQDEVFAFRFFGGGQAIRTERLYYYHCEVFSAEQIREHFSGLQTLIHRLPENNPDALVVNFPGSNLWEIIGPNDALCQCPLAKIPLLPTVV